MVENFVLCVIGQIKISPGKKKRPRKKKKKILIKGIQIPILV